MLNPGLTQDALVNGVGFNHKTDTPLTHDVINGDPNSHKEVIENKVLRVDRNCF